jgi:hypothetical protein
MFKSILRSAAVQSALGVVLATYMRLVNATTRWSVVGADVYAEMRSCKSGMVGLFWHSRSMLMPSGWPPGAAPGAIIVSQSPDGEFVAQACSRVGIAVIRGSSRNKKKTKDKRSLSAFREMLTHVKDGGIMAITPDGPRGPRMRVQDGPILLARMAGAPIYLHAWATSNHFRLGTWDRYFLPLPFGRGVRAWAGPIAPPADGDPASVEAVRRACEDLLNQITLDAERAVGATPVLPAPEGSAAQGEEDRGPVADAA